MEKDAVRLAEFIEAGLVEDDITDRWPLVLVALVGMQGSLVRALMVLYNESQKNGQRGNVAAKILGVPQELIDTVKEMEFAGMRPVEIVQMLQEDSDVSVAWPSDSSVRGRRVSS